MNHIMLPFFFSFVLFAAAVLGKEPLLFKKNLGQPASNKNFLSEKCPPSINGPLLELVEGIRVHETPAETAAPFGCARTLECNFISSPTDTTISWYKNKKLIGTNAVRELALGYVSPQQVPTSGVGEMTHRICADPFLRSASEQPTEFKCRARLGCDPSMVVESSPLIIMHTPAAASYADNKAAGEKERRSMKSQIGLAPLIEQITSSRIEVAGNLAQMVCNASGYPKPRVEWFILSEDLNNAYPVEQFPFILKMTNGDLLVDTADTNRAALNFKCQATNRLGKDSALGTLIILES